MSIFRGVPLLGGVKQVRCG